MNSPLSAILFTRKLLLDYTNMIRLAVGFKEIHHQDDDASF